MIDNDDADDMMLVALFTDGPWGVVALVVACIFMFYACQNEKDCSTQACPNGGQPKLMAHDCLCVTKAEKSGEGY